MFMRLIRLNLIVALMLLVTGVFTGCSDIIAEKKNGVVIARRAQIRSSTAVAAADLLEVVRGDSLEILDEYESPDEARERWLRVRASDKDSTEGWIEARNVLAQEIVDRSQQLSEEHRNVLTQATGQLRANTNLRLTPDISDDAGILFKLESGTRLDIISWKRIPKPKAEEEKDTDDAPKSAPQRGNNRRQRQEDAPPPEEYDTWYLVRLPRTVSPAPAGWLYGKQVELTVPSDVIFYRTGREFVAWHRIDDWNNEAAGREDNEDKDARPGSWVILEKSSTNKDADTDFDRVYVLGYDRERQEHYTAYRGGDIKGVLPLRVEGMGGDKVFVVATNDNGELKNLQYKISRDSRGILKVSQVK